MIEEIKSYFNNKIYYIIFTNSNIYIKNYKKIKNIGDKECNIIMDDKTIKIRGKNLKLVKSCDLTLELSGNVESIETL